jgi:hypothetical protein
MWEARYKRALILARGPIRKFSIASADGTGLVFPDVGGDVPDLIRSIIYGDGAFGGVL